MLALLADAAKEGRDVITGMLIVGLIFLGVIGLGHCPTSSESTSNGSSERRLDWAGAVAVDDQARFRLADGSEFERDLVPVIGLMMRAAA
jgi:hypothetical protein